MDHNLDLGRMNKNAKTPLVNTQGTYEMPYLLHFCVTIVTFAIMYKLSISLFKIMTIFFRTIRIVFVSKNRTDYHKGHA